MRPKPACPLAYVRSNKTGPPPLRSRPNPLATSTACAPLPVMKSTNPDFTRASTVVGSFVDKYGSGRRSNASGLKRTVEEADIEDSRPSKKKKVPTRSTQLQGPEPSSLSLPAKAQSRIQRKMINKK
ncbi:hypothetical protein K435DRAFT_881152 [Dendrothele bispora CBS 962.96]|uniref:Uncharacterized protein n=1 Tax=Dendrothele bispora (strain CBS 962.96) TaxID=1314807 RepID=A0A4S8KIQ7_DENBC|nr:hypothetical protein K435DRAFT_881152 [Dendrothele bispora CBS 962.96]